LRTDLELQTLQLTRDAGKVLYHGKKVLMKIEKDAQEDAIEAALSAPQGDLFDCLKMLRAKLAKEAGIPAYVVFSNATLSDMAQKQPKNMSQFKKVSGVGELKAAWYGKAFLEEIKKYNSGQC